MTMTEIARLAGVSQATVSRVLNGSDGVARNKREAVMRIVGDTGFLSRGAARHDGREVLLGIVMQDAAFSNPGIMMRKCESIASNVPGSCGVVLLPSDITAPELRLAVRMRGIGGLLLVGHGCSDPELCEFLSEFPHVWLNSHNAGGGCTVLAGNEAAGRLAAGYLLERSCRHVAVLSLRSGNPGFQPRVGGFRFEVFAAGLESSTIAAPEEMPEFESLDDRELEVRLDAVMSPEVCSAHDGVFVPDDRVTALLYRIFRRRNLSPQKQPLIVSCNNESEFLAGLYPRPATIDLAPALTARMALEQLVRMTRGEKPDDKVAIVVRPELIPGE